MDSRFTAFLAILPTRLLSAPSGMLLELSSTSLSSVVAASALSFWMNSDCAVDVCLWAIFLFLPWNRLTLVLYISVSNFGPRVFTRLLIASDQFGPFSNAIGWTLSTKVWFFMVWNDLIWHKNTLSSLLTPIGLHFDLVQSALTITFAPVFEKSL